MDNKKEEIGIGIFIAAILANFGVGSVAGNCNCTTKASTSYS